MHVDTHLRGDLEEFAWEDLPIRHDDEVVTVKLANIVQELLIPTDLHRLEYRDTLREGELLHGTCLHDLITTPWLVRIGNDEDNIISAIRTEICENCGSKRWSTEESDTKHREILVLEVIQRIL
jgi:hypothetical protein